MKKVICLIAAVALCAALVIPAIAAGGFVKSITYKGSPDLRMGHKEGGNIILLDEKKVLKAIDAADESCLLVTSVAEAKKSKDISDDAKELLLKVYQELSNGKMVLPYEKVEGIDADKMVIRELLDVTLICDHDHGLEEEDVGIVLTFDLGVAADDVLAVMSYVDGEWLPAVEVVNNGDGTVTCALRNLCPVAFAIEA